MEQGRIPRSGPLQGRPPRTSRLARIIPPVGAFGSLPLVEPTSITGKFGEERLLCTSRGARSTARAQRLFGLSSCSQANFPPRSPNLPLATLSRASQGGRRNRISFPRAATYTNTWGRVVCACTSHTSGIAYFGDISPSDRSLPEGIVEGSASSRSSPPLSEISAGAKASGDFGQGSRGKLGEPKSCGHSLHPDQYAEASSSCPSIVAVCQDRGSCRSCR